MGQPFNRASLRYTDAAGVKRVAGGPGLKGTQMYTPEFGRALAAWWMAHGPVSAGTELKSKQFLSKKHLLEESQQIAQGCTEFQKRITIFPTYELSHV